MDLTDLDFETGANFINKQKLHIRYQQSGKRDITIIEGFEKDLDLKRISKALKKLFGCACSIHIDDDDNEIIKLQGNHCDAVRDWIIQQEIIPKNEAADRIVIHGS
jgi:translation initiation factor 1